MPTRDENVPVGNEHPDPDTPPTETAGGETGVTHQEHGKGQFQEAYDSVPDEVAAVGSIEHDDEPEAAEPPKPASAGSDEVAGS